VDNLMGEFCAAAIRGSASWLVPMTLCRRLDGCDALETKAGSSDVGIQQSVDRKLALVMAGRRNRKGGSDRMSVRKHKCAMCHSGNEQQGGQIGARTYGVGLRAHGDLLIN
jgi:hypothetical protein